MDTCKRCGQPFRRLAKRGPYCSAQCRPSDRWAARCEAAKPLYLLRCIGFLGQVLNDGTEALLVPPEYAVEELLSLGFEMTEARLRTLLVSSHIDNYR